MPKPKILGAAAMTVALATGGIVGATVGYPTISGAAQDPTTTTTPADDTTSAAPDGERGPGHGGRGHGLDLDVAAEALGITTDECAPGSRPTRPWPRWPRSRVSTAKS